MTGPVDAGAANGSRLDVNGSEIGLRPLDYVQVCENIGLNPMMRPFAYIKSRELCRGIWVSEDRRAKACRLFNDEAAVPKSPESILEKSALAERHVRECRELVERQRALVARHKAAGRDASSSEVLLGEIQHSLDVFEKHYRSIQAELEEVRGTEAILARGPL